MSSVCQEVFVHTVASSTQSQVRNRCLQLNVITARCPYTRNPFDRTSKVRIADWCAMFPSASMHVVQCRRYTMYTYTICLIFCFQWSFHYVHPLWAWKQHHSKLRLLACRWPRKQGWRGGWHQWGWDRPCRLWTQGQRWNVLCSCVYSCGILNTWNDHKWYVAGIWMMPQPEADPACKAWTQFCTWICICLDW